MDRISTSTLVSAESSNEESSIKSQIADFGRSFVHSSLENPVNGLRQIANQTSLVNLPEFDIVRDTKPSLASNAGDIAGSVATFAVLAAGGNRLMGNIGGEGMRGTLLRAGITGAVFDGVLKPTHENSATFWKDRTTNALVGAATFAGMAASADGLNRTGLFAVPEARSLHGSIAYGAIAGIGGGLAHAQAEALFKDGKLLASPKSYLNDSLTFAAFGGAFGAVGYGTEKVLSSLGNRVIETKSDNASIRVKLDRNGEVAQVQTILPSVNTRGAEVKVTNSRMTDGNWSSSAGARYADDTGVWRNFLLDARPYKVAQVNRSANGEVRILDTEGSVRAFSPKGEYSNYEIGQRVLGEKFDYQGPWGTRIVADNSQLRQFNSEGRLTDFKDWNNKSINGFAYDQDGSIRYLSAFQEGGMKVDLYKVKNEWRASLSDVTEFSERGINSSTTKAADMFKWNGEVKAVSNNSFQIIPDGKSPITFRPGDATKALEATLRAQQ